MIRRTVTVILALTWILATGALADEAEQRVAFDKRSLNGPRFGLTYVAGEGELQQQLEANDMGRVLSQFGWHFERQVIPEGGGPQFVVEAVPMLAGVEYGKFIPSLTLAMGVRFPGGWEFGMGPNFFTSEDSNGEITGMTSLVLAMGKSFRYGGVSIPVNLAASTAPEGNRFSLVFGYAVGKVPTETKTSE